MSEMEYTFMREDDTPMAELEPIVVPMPGFVSPDPKTAAGSINYDGQTTLAEHPVEHSPDFAGDASVSDRTADEGGDTSEMTVADLKAEAKKRGLSGYSEMNKEELVALLEADDEDKS